MLGKGYLFVGLSFVLAATTIGCDRYCCDDYGCYEMSLGEVCGFSTYGDEGCWADGGSEPSGSCSWPDGGDGDGDSDGDGDIDGDGDGDGDIDGDGDGDCDGDGDIDGDGDGDGDGDCDGDGDIDGDGDGDGDIDGDGDGDVDGDGDSDGDGDVGTSSCVPGRSLACACPDGRQGAQICRADGTFDPCLCTTSPDGGSEEEGCLWYCP